MIWTLIILALFIASICKSPIGKAIARRIDGKSSHRSHGSEIKSAILKQIEQGGIPGFNSQKQSTIKTLETKVETLEEQVQILISELSSLKNEYQFLETLLETDNTNKKQLSD